MTTPIPYGAAPPPPPPGAPPLPEYRAAPPWAPPEPPAAAVPAPYAPHGQLMVPFPELVPGAERPRPPSWRPVALTGGGFALAGTVVAAAVCTVISGEAAGVALGGAGGVLGLLGAVPAARRARLAKRYAQPRYPYWLAFVLAPAVAAVPGLVAADLTAALVQSRVVEPAATEAVRSDLVHGNRIALPTGVSVVDATCTPSGARRTDGLRSYRCVVTLSTGRSGPLAVVADRHGHWTRTGR
jgi:hypothetical protein